MGVEKCNLCTRCGTYVTVTTGVIRCVGEDYVIVLLWELRNSWNLITPTQWIIARHHQPWVEIERKKMVSNDERIFYFWLYNLLHVNILIMPIQVFLQNMKSLYNFPVRTLDPHYFNNIVLWFVDNINAHYLVNFWGGFLYKINHNLIKIRV